MCRLYSALPRWSVLGRDASAASSAAWPMLSGVSGRPTSASAAAVAPKLTVRLIAEELRQAGYNLHGTQKDAPMGTYQESDGGIIVFPGPQSYHAQDSATIHVDDGVVNSITDDHGQALASYELEPVLITGLSEDANRTKRRLVTYDEIPQNLVHAVLAIEDRRFFEHSGVNYFRLAEATIRDVTTGQKAQGGSTLTMQLARGFFYAPKNASSARSSRSSSRFSSNTASPRSRSLSSTPTRSTLASAAAFPSTASAKPHRPTSAKMSNNSIWRKAPCSPGMTPASQLLLSPSPPS